MKTREKIIFESLKLFAREGFEATSTRAIARSINCSDAVIYKHFKSKKEILDAIIEICSSRLMEESVQTSIEGMSWNELEIICLKMFEFQTKDEWIVLFRKLLVIEQFRNRELEEIYREVFVKKPLKIMEDIFENLIKLGYMKGGNPKVYAMNLYSPFFMFHIVGDEEAENVNILKEHIALFKKNVVVDKKM